MNDTWWVRPDQLDDDQRPLINLPLADSYTILGPPGSGKTNLLVLRATHLLRSNKKRVLLLVFSRTLEEFLASCPTPYRLPRDNLRTCQRWEMELINQLGGRPSTNDDFESMRQENVDILNGLLDAQHLGKLYDVLLLDEAQDYLVPEIELFFRLADYVFAAGDGRQRIYNHPDPIPDLRRRSKVKELKLHYRNGRKICLVADAIGKEWADYVPIINSSQYDEAANPSTVIVRGGLDIDRQGQEIVASVQHQLISFPDELIGVICPRRAELKLLSQVLAASDLNQMVAYQHSDHGPIQFRDTTRICVCTVHGAKGLEFRAVHIAGAEFFKNFRERQRRMAYTAVTRAKTALTVYHASSLTASLSGALAAANPPRSPPEFDSLFEDA